MNKLIDRQLKRLSSNSLKYSSIFCSRCQSSSQVHSSRKLMLYNSFTRSKQVALADNRPVIVGDWNERCGTAYVCGPTVYDHSHLGHAVTYLRFDLFRRILKSFCSIDLVTVMNITDVDDKIIDRANRESKTHTQVSNFYMKEFMDDMKSLNILPADALIKVTDQIQTITEYIQQIERQGRAYVNEKTGDVCIDIAKIEDYPKAIGHSSDEGKAAGKQENRDFVLWKASKPNEPNWPFHSISTNRIIQGRPGWHVECSAISNQSLGGRLDFHFGGQDLQYPHHLNESACCKAFFGHEQSMYDWVSNWIHFGQFIIKNKKMSKSLGNGILIKDYLRDHPKNMLRIICLMQPYKRDIYYDENFLKRAYQTHHKLEQFQSQIDQQLLKKLRTTPSNGATSVNLEQQIQTCVLENLEGIADDMDVSRGLQAMMKLISEIEPSLNKLAILDLIKLKKHFNHYLIGVGLTESQQETKSDLDRRAIEKFIDFRSQVRSTVLNGLKGQKSETILQQVLKCCDNIRESVKNENFHITDK